jgi:hypothetical protein
VRRVVIHGLNSVTFSCLRVIAVMLTVVDNLVT